MRPTSPSPSHRIKRLKVDGEEYYKMLVDRVGEEISWQAHRVYLGMSRSMVAKMQRELILLMHIYTAQTSQKLFGPLGSYDVESPKSLARFWKSELGIQARYINDSTLRSKGVHVYVVGLGAHSIEALDQLPRGLVKLGKGIGFQLSVPSPAEPPHQMCLVKNVPMIAAATQVEQALRGIPGVKDVGTLTRVVTAEGTWLGRYLAPVVLKEGVEGEEMLISKPYLGKWYSVEVAVASSVTITVCPPPSCHTCGDPDHAAEECPIVQRLKSDAMPVFLFTSRTPTAATIIEVTAEPEAPAPTAAPAVKESKAKGAKKGKGKGKATRGKQSK
jgi:hypothetical protein